MKRSKLLEDFNVAFPNLDKRKIEWNETEYKWYYKNEITRYAWIAWVSAFETYSNEPLEGGYESSSPNLNH